MAGSLALSDIILARRSSTRIYATATVLKPMEPLNVVELFPEERAELLALLYGLSADQWALPTICPGWSVSDISRHLLADDLGRLSRIRDAFVLAAPPDLTIVQLVSELNAEWVTATRRLSPRLVCELIAVTGEWTQEHFVTLDLGAVGSPVSWVGPDPAPIWLDVAREYTWRPAEWRCFAAITPGTL
jgi:hypothetical protein